MSGFATEDRLSPDDMLALAIASGNKVAVAASIAHLSEATAFRRMKDPKFQAIVEEIRRDIRGRVVGKIVEAMDDAIAELQREVNDDQLAVGDRQNAATSLIENGIRVHSYMELSKRVAALEEKAS